MKKFLQFTLLSITLFIGGKGFAQPGSMSVNQDVGGTYANTVMSLNGGVFQARFLETATTTTGTRNWQFNSDSYNNVWGATAANTLAAYNATIVPSTATASGNWVAAGYNAFGRLPVTTTGRYYTYNIIRGTSYASQRMSVLETAYNPVTIPTVSHVAAGSATRQVTITTSAAPNASERIFVRYSNNNFVSSSIVQATGSGTTWTATIPFLSGTVNFYVYTSSLTKATIDTNVTAQSTQEIHDISTLNSNNNSGANYSYTPTANFTVTSAGGTFAGAGIQYGSLTNSGGAFEAINAAAAGTGAITILQTGDSTAELGTFSLNNGTNWTSIVLNPQGARTISGAPAAGTPMINFAGADNVTFNGLNTGGNSLTISNTTVAATSGTSTIRFETDATNNTITNCSVLGSSTMAVGTNGGNIWFGAGSSVTGNDNNTISNCLISSAGANLPSKGVYFSGTTTSTTLNNSGNTITGNNFENIFGAAVESAGIYATTGATANTFSNNKFYQTATRTWTTGALHSAIKIANTTSAAGYTITGNTIGYANNAGTGVYTLTGLTGKFIGISYNGAGLLANTDISNNTIANISLSGVTSSGTGTSSPFIGIFVNNGITTTNNNTIGSQTATGSLVFSTTTTTATDIYGIYNFSSSIWTSNNNLIGGISSTNAAATGIQIIYGMRANTGTAVTWTATGNTVGGSIANSIQLASSGTSSQVVGMQSANAPMLFTGNTIRNLTNNNGTGTSSGASVIGIAHTSTAPTNSITQSTIHNLNNSNATIASVVTGIQFTGFTGNVVSRNYIYNLTSATTSASAEINGIRVAGGTTNYSNNMIALGANVSNAIGGVASNSSATGINGFNGALGTDSFINNSVYIGGTSTAGTGASYAFNGIQTTNTRSFRNNIFVNNRTNSGGTGKNYAIKINGTTINPTGLTLNNNVYFGNGAGFVHGFFNSLDVADLAAWQTAVGQDTASFNTDPQYVNPTNSIPDLHINATVATPVESTGTDLGVTLDFDGETRSSLTPTDIGADAGNFVSAVASCIAPVDQATAFVAGAVTSNSAQATFTAATSVPTGYLVITSQGAFVGTPVDGTSYLPGAALGNGAVIQSNATTSINAIGLPSNTTGTITIYTYNSGSCAGGPKYNLVTPLTGTNTTCAGTPTLPVSNAITSTGFTANWTQTGGTAFPITYTIEVTTDAAFTLPVAGSPFASATNSLVVSGLNQATTYFWRVKGNNTICDSGFLNSSATTECTAITVFPSVEPFTSYLPSVCWKEGDLGDLVAGPSLISATASAWDVDGFLNSGTTGAARLNLFDAPDSDWLLTPFYTIPATGYRVKYNVGATQFNVATALTTPWEADDFVELLVSTSTTNWTVLKTYNSANVPSHLGQIDTADLTPYNGQTIRFAFRGVEGATNGGADLDFFVDNFTVEIEPIAIVVSSPVAVCNGDATTLTVTSANTNYVYTWSPASGLNTTTGATVIATPTATTTYTVTAVDGAMNTTGTVTVTVNPAPSAIIVTPATASVCVDDITPLVATGGLTPAVATIGVATTISGDIDELTAFCNRRVTLRSQTIYTAAELTASGLTAGNITSLSYNVNSLGDAATNADYNIRIGATANSNFATTTLLSTAGMTNVFPAATFTHTSSGWQLLNFATPYVWDGTSNIVVNVTQSGADDINNAQTFYSTTADNKTNFVFDNLAATTGTLTTRRMNIRFGYLSAAPITWAPTTDLYTDAGATVAYTGTAATTVYHKGASNTYTATATIGICTKTATSTITVNAPVLPTFFNPVAICAGGVVALPIISTNGITGTWSPAPNNTVTTIYNFTPDAGQCATSGAFITQTVNPILTSTFAQVAPICSGGTFTLPTTSIEGVVGTWSPVINNTVTTLYTFTPNAGQCGTTATMTVAVGTTTTWTAGFPNFWSNGAPTSIDGAIIATNYSESATLDACTLTVDNNAVVAIPAGTNVNVQGIVNVISGSMALANTANLNQSLDVTNSGNISVTCTTSPLMRQDYVLWSAPVTGQQLQSFSPGTLSNRFYTYNPSTDFYEAIASPSTTNFNEGTGYLIRVPNGHPTTPTTLTRTFTGVPNNGNVNMSVATGTWNAIGNPYPSTIDADEFITANGITDALYFWRKTNNAAGTAYATYTLAGGTSGTAPNITAPNVTSTIMTPNGTISVGQGFLAKATSSSLSFTNAMRNGDISTQFFRTNSVDRSRVWLNLFDNEFFVNQTMIAYMPTATNAIDAAVDGRFYENNIPTQLSSLINGEEFAVQGRAPFAVSDIVPLGFKVETAGNYSVAIDHVDGLFADGQEVFLKDNLTNTVHNLTNAPYSFVASPGTSNTRFEIVFESTLATENPVLNENTVVIFKQNQDIVVNTGSIEMKNVQVYDIQGRLLVEQKDINASTTKLSIGTTNQVLIVKVTSKDNSVVSKKVIN
jgi:hypothetical protein